MYIYMSFFPCIYLSKCLKIIVIEYKKTEPGEQSSEIDEIIDIIVIDNALTTDANANPRKTMS